MFPNSAWHHPRLIYWHALVLYMRPLRSWNMEEARKKSSCCTAVCTQSCEVVSLSLDVIQQCNLGTPVLPPVCLPHWITETCEAHDIIFLLRLTYGCVYSTSSTKHVIFVRQRVLTWGNFPSCSFMFWYLGSPAAQVPTIWPFLQTCYFSCLVQPERLTVQS